MLCETRELCNQVASVYEKLILNTDITLANFQMKVTPAHIVVSTLGKVSNNLFGKR